MVHRRTSVVRSARAVALTLVIASGLALASAGPAAAAEFSVSTTTDGGAGSLRDAFAQASASAEPNEIILQADATYVLSDCAEGDLDYANNQPLTIIGNGAVIEQECPGERVIESGGDITVTDTSVTGGETAGLGGGIEADTSDVTVVRSTVSNNSASSGGGIGAIRVTLTDSTVTGNEASTGGGAWADQTLSVTNSTVAENEATTAGGGLAVVNTSITLLYATVTRNNSPTGANLQVQAGGDELVSFASIVADPFGGGADCDIDAGATTTSQGYNLSGDNSCGFGSGPGDQPIGGNPGLGLLADNGGPTQTELPAATSTVIDAVECAASPAAIDADQRGVARPQNGVCDIGAVELEPATSPTTTTPPTSPRAPSALATPRFTG